MPPAPPSRPKRLGRRPATTQAASPWLYQHLTISGPDAVVTSFAETARGSGIVPWRLEAARLEEDIFNLAASQPSAIRSLTIAGCRILARQFCERVEDRAARAAARVGRSRACPGRACPFDLHTLLIVPAPIFELGPTHPEAQAWLAKNWGLTDTPRQVTERHGAKSGRRLPAGHTVVGYSFFTAGETPHAAIVQLGSRWPALRFVLRPRPLD